MPEMWIARDGKKFGPFAEPVVRDQYAKGKVLAGDLVWKDGMAKWEPASQVLAVAAPFAAEPAFPPPPLVPPVAGGGAGAVKEPVWFLEPLRKYATFSGRARRMEYWMFSLAVFIGSLLFAVVDVAFGTAVLGIVFALAILLPALAVTVRRLHDTGRSGWWLLIALVPFAGPIVLLVFACLDSEPGENQYGPNPKG